MYSRAKIVPAADRYSEEKMQGAAEVTATPKH